MSSLHLISLMNQIIKTKKEFNEKNEPTRYAGLFEPWIWSNKPQAAKAAKQPAIINGRFANPPGGIPISGQAPDASACRPPSLYGISNAII
jgi:hypothetical protein